jgi:Predicted membrane protein (DUF2207)
MRHWVLRLSFAVVVCGLLVPGGFVEAQPWDRVVHFHSEVSVAIDRTLTVREKIEIENAAGEDFGDGLRRLIPIRPAGDYRAKQNSVEAVSAKVDGADGVIEVSEGTQYIGIRVRPPDGPWAHGMHTVELNYVVKHQFAIEDSSEGLSWDVAGHWVWLVPVEKADVQLMLPDGWPPGSSLSYETCTLHGYKFDCASTELPLGGKFESTQSLDPRNTLVIHARFSKRGHFVSNVKEDGLRAVFENHPRLKRLKPTPWGMFIAGFIVLVAVGFALLQIPAVRNARPSPHALAVLVSVIATILSTISMGLVSPYAAMPGAGIGLYAIFLLSQRPDSGGGSILFALLLGLGTNLVFYYFAALGLRLLWLRFTSRGITRNRGR